RGIFEMAEGGTLFLDEIGEMPMHLQTKLLSALEDKKIRRLGGDFIRPVSVRIIAASSTDLETSLGRTFRSDLYYRLSVVRIHIPPLRERRQDIPELCGYILRQVARGREMHLPESELQKLSEYEWPGNIRELKNILERASLLQKGPLLAPSDFLVKAAPARACPPVHPVDDLVPLAEVERNYIRYVLRRLSDNHTRAAKALGISLSTLKRKLKEYQLR
ncbi:MAG: sigma 54-interacting transcriptional regulator, partial [Nitrospirales bacterium]|nr:sigma 54-interacting transcriptional regulator [Nitrospirales bacterium]